MISTTLGRWEDSSAATTSPAAASQTVRDDSAKRIMSTLDGGELLEAGPLVQFGERPTVDGFDMDEAGRAVIFALSAHEAADVVAGAQVEAADEAGAHVGIVGAGQEFFRAEEAVPIAPFVHDFEQAMAFLLVALFGLLAQEGVDQVRFGELFVILQACFAGQLAEGGEALFAEADSVGLERVGVIFFGRGTAALSGTVGRAAGRS